jgi:hypothetical protein
MFADVTQKIYDVQTTQMFSAGRARSIQVSNRSAAKDQNPKDWSH